MLSLRLRTRALITRKRAFYIPAICQANNPYRSDGNVRFRLYTAVIERDGKIRGRRVPLLWRGIFEARGVCPKSDGKFFNFPGSWGGGV